MYQKFPKQALQFYNNKLSLWKQSKNGLHQLKQISEQLVILRFLADQEAKVSDINSLALFYVYLKNLANHIVEMCITGYEVMHNSVHSTWKSKEQLSHILQTELLTTP